MPYYRKRRNYGSKRYTRKRRGGGNSWATYGAKAGRIAQMAWQGVQKLRGLVNSEMYKVTNALTANLNGGSPYIQHITGVAQGDGDGQRTGNSIFVRSYNFKGILKFEPAGNAQQSVRVSLVQDTQQVGDNPPSYTDVYQANTPYSHLNDDTVGRFKILSSRLYILSSNRPGIPITLNKAMRHHVRYNGANATDIQKGGIYLMIESDSAGANYPSFVGEDRLSYHDN